ncbi:hypothetical protein [Lachnoclostridium sp. Marseille-P6806]|uniref:hypothetical protein n=1 Tax=Lachnoclostridium sp. Marseille-P6806 TaxID=2364793 RepID=UPI0013EEFBED|nr:hypothetical protein [Lachnoclostridium sp. Marseille-P6806]
MNIIFEKPILNKPTPEQNIALLDTWAAETTDKLNYVLHMLKAEEKNSDNKDHQ